MVPYFQFLTELNTYTFYPELGKLPFAIVMFYAPWCHHCHDLMPEYENADAILKSMGINGLFRFDCDQARSFCESLHIPGFPMVKVFNFGKDVETFDGERKTANIVKFAETKFLKYGNPPSTYNQVPPPTYDQNGFSSGFINQLWNQNPVPAPVATIPPNNWFRPPSLLEPSDGLNYLNSLWNTVENNNLNTQDYFKQEQDHMFYNPYSTFSGSNYLQREIPMKDFSPPSPSVGSFYSTPFDFGRGNYLMNYRPPMSPLPTYTTYPVIKKYQPSFGERLPFNNPSVNYKYPQSFILPLKALPIDYNRFFPAPSFTGDKKDVLQKAESVMWNPECDFAHRALIKQTIFPNDIYEKIMKKRMEHPQDDINISIQPRDYIHPYIKLKKQEDDEIEDVVAHLIQNFKKNQVETTSEEKTP